MLLGSWVNSILTWASKWHHISELLIMSGSIGKRWVVSGDGTWNHLVKVRARSRSSNWIYLILTLWAILNICLSVWPRHQGSVLQNFVESFFKSKDLFSWKRFLQKLRIILDNAIFSLFYGNIFLWYYTS